MSGQYKITGIKNASITCGVCNKVIEPNEEGNYTLPCSCRADAIDAMNNRNDTFEFDTFEIDSVSVIEIKNESE